MYNPRNIKKFSAFIIAFCFLISAYGSLAYEMGSDSYRIQESSINVGGHSQTSTSYRMRDTIGEFAAGTATSASYKLKMGYQPMLEIYIAISSVSPQQVTMSPNIGGLTGGQSNGLTSINVITDNPSGYSLFVRSVDSPALITSSYSFADYTSAVSSVPDFTWLVPATTSEFGFTPYGSDTVTKYRYIGATCNLEGTADPDHCWYNFSTSSDEAIASSYSSNHPSGTETTINFKADSGNQNVQPPGQYQATIITTVIAN